MEAENRFDVIVMNIYLRQLKEYESTKRLKADERKSLREWVSEYNSVYRNPFYVYGDDGEPVDYITAYRQCVKEHKIALRKELKEYERSIVDLTDEERSDLREWVSAGNSVYDNPFYVAHEGGYSVDYIQAIRTIDEMREDDYKSMLTSDEGTPF